MTRVWQWNRPVTVREVLEDLQRERSIAYTTVMTVLDNLHQKGWVRREVAGRAYRYTAVSTRAAYSAALMNEAWSKSDNPAAALVAFFGMMSPGQREALNDAIRIVQRDTPEGAAPRERETPGKGSPAVPGEPPNAPARDAAPDTGTARADESAERGDGQGRPGSTAGPAGPQSAAERPAESPADGFGGTTPQSTAQGAATPSGETPQAAPRAAPPAGGGPGRPAPVTPAAGTPAAGTPVGPAHDGTPAAAPTEPAGPVRPAGGPGREGGEGPGGAER